MASDSNSGLAKAFPLPCLPRCSRSNPDCTAERQLSSATSGMRSSGLGKSSMYFSKKATQPTRTSMGMSVHLCTHLLCGSVADVVTACGL